MLVIKDDNGVDRLVFVHLQKCAGTFVNNLLLQMYPKSYRPFLGFKKKQKGMHHIPHYELDKIHNKYSHLKNLSSFGVVRNPWDFYASIYHFEKMKADSHWARRSTYNQLGGPENFELYIKKLFGDNKIKDNMNRKSHAELFQRMHAHDIGILSARYLNLFFEKGIFNKSIEHIDKNKRDLIRTNYIVRCENIYNELCSVIKSSGLSHPGLKSKKIFNEFVSSLVIDKNESSRGHYKEYYTEELVDIVGHKERLIVNQYNYKFD